MSKTSFRTVAVVALAFAWLALAYGSLWKSSAASLAGLATGTVFGSLVGVIVLARLRLRIEHLARGDRFVATIATGTFVVLLLLGLGLALLVIRGNWEYGIVAFGLTSLATLNVGRLTPKGINEAKKSEKLESALWVGGYILLLLMALGSGLKAAVLFNQTGILNTLPMFRRLGALLGSVVALNLLTVAFSASRGLVRLHLEVFVRLLAPLVGFLLLVSGVRAVSFVTEGQSSNPQGLFIAALIAMLTLTVAVVSAYVFIFPYSILAILGVAPRHHREDGLDQNLSLNAEIELGQAVALHRQKHQARLRLVTTLVGLPIFLAVAAAAASEFSKLP